MELRFDEIKHEYKLGRKKLPSVTQILSTTVFPHKYDGVGEDVLKTASAKGKVIHQEIENYVNENAVGFTKELDNFIDIVKSNELKLFASEVMCHNGEIAGTIDLDFEIEGKHCLADIKTTYELDREYVSWQLSFYAYILECNGIHIDELYAIWLRDDEYKFEKVEKKDTKVLLDVLSHFHKGDIYELSMSKLQTIPLEKQNALKSLLVKMEEAEKKTKEIKEAIKKEMEDRGIYKIEIEDLVITLVPEHETTKLDSKKLKEDNEELYNSYLKTSTVKSCIKTSFKK